MGEFLMASFEGGGNVPPFVGAVRRLVSRGHRVRVLGDDSMRADVAAAGGEFRPWQRAYNRPDRTAASDQMRDWEPTEPGGDLLRLLDRLTIGPAGDYAEDTLAELSREPAHALVSCDLLLGPMMAAEAAGVPCAVLSTNISLVPIEGMPPPGPGIAPPRSAEEHAIASQAARWYAAALEERLPGYNAARGALGLPPLSDPLDQIRRADLILLGTSSAFDFPVQALPPRTRYVGPLLDPPRWAAAIRAPDVEAGRPLVLVALSSTFQDQAPVIQAVLDAAADLPAQVVVTRGPALAGHAFHVSGNALLLDGADHDRLMAHAACVVTHAGHGTVMRALSHGLPLLCMPMGRDQNDNAARVVARGAGLRLPESASAGEIRSALLKLLEDPGFRTAAAQLGRAIRFAEPPDELETALEELIPVMPSRVAAGE
jgi:MGT family glycosyltransferase